MSSTESHTFNDPTADITFASCDGVLFKMHKKHLEITTGGFPSFDKLVVDSDPVPLPESAAVLDVLFRFIRPPLDSERNCQPDLSDLDHLLFFSVAEAAEKYMVYGAMNTSMIHMLHTTESNPLEILNHAAKHGYSKLSNKAAALSLSQTDLLLAQKLTHPGVLNRFLIYRAQWTSVKASALQQISVFIASGHQNCAQIQDLRARYLEQTNARPQSGAEIPNPDDSLTCGRNRNRVNGNQTGCQLPLTFLNMLKAQAQALKAFSEVTN
ncbi:hypothetical protein CPB83DRAFT_850468 [Crepidotus variabilis]|uniref:BTB domain-containing protein n=1 Tax=Crepidotus variabilis TaxID=179855 RepID=A0A9P6JS45_9AGAR|nr:hypothetical protein CPB83DRAFT_850468 [Crepidotus variabilis]